MQFVSMMFSIGGCLACQTWSKSVFRVLGDPWPENRAPKLAFQLCHSWVSFVRCIQNSPPQFSNVTFWHDNCFSPDNQISICVPSYTLLSPDAAFLLQPVDVSYCSPCLSILLLRFLSLRLCCLLLCQPFQGIHLVTALHTLD